MIRISAKDNVLVDPANGHKYAARNIKCGEAVIKYGFPIGFASDDIPDGAHVHTQNMRTGLSGIEDFRYSGGAEYSPSPCGETVMAYRRPQGTGIRSDIWIIPTVGCINGLAMRLAAASGAYALCHPYGCSQSGEDKLNTELTIRGLALNPNAAGVLILGLGCENTNIEVMKKHFEGFDTSRIRYLNAQDADDEFSEGLAILAELRAAAEAERRVPVPISSLRIGLKCGGSDGLSGITANPLIGRFTDRFTSVGGMAALTEIPEMFGAESIMLSRCRDRSVFGRLLDVINDCKNSFIMHGEPIYENPSAGNKAGGITTLEEKSLGCVQKGGHAAVTDVIRRGGFVKEPGLTVLDCPGNDMVSSTGLTAAGCCMILFSTGRGTPYGAPVPTLKISTNSALAAKKSSWMDFDAGPALSGEDLLPALWQLVRDTAEGRPAKNELNGCRDIAVFKSGITQ